MTTKSLESAPATSSQLPIVEPQRGACIEFVKFCKEQHLNARAAKTFLRVLRNKNWDHECDTIRESMRPEVESLFAPVEKALSDGANCREVLALLVSQLKKTEEL